MSPAADRLELTGLRVTARHGLLPEERERAQPFEIDLVLEADLGPAARADDLSLTVDYGAVVSRVVEVATLRQFGLLEALAQAIASAVLAEEKVVAVTVTVRKLRPPVPSDLASAAVTLRRTLG